MTNADPKHLETLEALLAEKRKLEGYLAKLEERRAGTPEHVFLRLRDEYLTKLTDAQVRASAEAESLSGGLERDETAVREIEATLAAFEEERIEGELRAAVGEFDQAEWEKRLAGLSAQIAAAQKERDARRTVFERTRDLLAEARGTLPNDERADLPPAEEGPSAPSAAAAAEEAPLSAPKLRATTAIRGAPNFDELEFLNSVVGRPSTPTPNARPIIEGGSAPLPRPITEGPSARPSGAIPAPALPESKQAAEPQLPLTPPVPPSPAPAPRAATPPVPPPAAPAAAAPAPAPIPEPTSVEDIEESTPSPLGRPTPRTSQAIKTLKCAECGSMNYPTEWYCERCGGELAAL